MNKFKILLLFLGISLVGYSQSPITVKQGDSFTALLVFDNAYDVNRLQDISVSINRQEVARKSTGGIVATNNVRAFRVPLSSTTMRRFQGSNTLEVAVDDSILGVRRIAPLTLIVSASQNAFSNGSVNTGIDATINMTISATSITTNTVLAQVMKGDKGDKGDAGSGGGGTSIDTTLYVRKVTGYQLSQNNYTAAEKSKLSGIASGATANSTDAQLRDRSTHTGTQAQSTVTNLVSDLAAKLNISDTTVLLRKTTAAGLYQPKGSYLTSINSSQVTTALGFTPYNATNPSGYITSSALSPYLTTSSATSTYQPLLVSGTTIKTINGASLLGSGNIVISGSGTAIDTTLFLQKTTAAGLYQPKGSYLTTSTAASTYQPIGSYLVSGDLAAYLPKSDTTLYVRKVTGYQLSQSNYTSAEKSKLSGIASGAEVNVNADWNAVSGDAEILNKPTLGTASTLNVAATGNAATGEVVKGNDTRLSDARTPTAHNHTASNITDFDAAVAANSAVAANTAKVTNATHTGDVTGSATLTYNNVLPANKGGAGTVSGILKANGSGTVSAATAGTDYVIPSGNITGTSGGLSVDIPQSRVTNLVSDLGAKADTTLLTTKLETLSSVAGLQAYTKANFALLDGSIWEKKSGNVTSNGGSAAGTLIRVSSSVYWERKIAGNTYYPEWFGAVGDGATDDADEIQNCISATPDGGIFQIKGWYKISKKIVVTGNRITLKANGYTLPTIQSAAGFSDSCMFQFQGYGYLLDGFSLIGDGGSNGVGATVNGIRFVRGNGTKDIDSKVKGCAFSGFALALYMKGTNLEVVDNAFSSSLQCIQFDRNSTDESRGLVVFNNRFHSCGTIGAAAKCIVLNSDAFSCIVENNYADAIYTFIEAPVNGTSINNNRIYKAAGDAIVTIEATYTTQQRTGTVSGNTIYLNAPSYVGAGIVLALRNGQCIGNTIVGARKHGVVGGNVTSCIVSQNTVLSHNYNAATDGAIYDGIYLDASCNSNIVSENHIRSAGIVGRSAINVESSTNVVMQNWIDDSYTTPYYTEKPILFPNNSNSKIGIKKAPTANLDILGTTLRIQKPDVISGAPLEIQGSYTKSGNAEFLTHQIKQTLASSGAGVEKSGYEFWSLNNGTMQKKAEIPWDGGFKVNDITTITTTTGGTGTFQGLGSGTFSINSNGTLLLGSAGSYYQRIDAGGVGINTGNTANHTSAQFQIDATTKGALLPRITATQRDAISSPATGLELYNTTANTKDVYDGTAWRSLATTAHVTTAISTKADIASPTFTGTPTAPTATAGTNTTQIATTAYVEDAKNKTLESLEVAFGDETTAITTGNGKLTFYMPYAMTVTEVFLAVKTAQSSGSVFTVDINEEGVSILSTKLTLDNNELKSSTAATPAVVSDTSLAKWATMTIDVDQSSGIAVGGKIIINGYRQ